MSIQAKLIKQFILTEVPNHSNDIVTVAANKFQVTRTTIHRHLTSLLQQGKIIKAGTTRNITYTKKDSFSRCMNYMIKSTTSEFDVLKKDFQDLFQLLPENIYDICVYGFTEIFNNSIDHSKGTKITVITECHNNVFSICIKDDGIGIFKKIHDYLNLNNLREAVFQTTKGKITTDPSNHTGEGIFFTSRAFDRFEIYANKIHFLRDNHENDWSIETIKTSPGTTVCMSIKQDSPTKLIQLFKSFQNTTTFAFARTEIIVALSRFGDEPFISRSQAKRVILGLEKFKHITLDFSTVRLVGQGFVDEVFRVFSNAHPEIKIDYINANDDVTFMI